MRYEDKIDSNPGVNALKLKLDDDDEDEEDDEENDELVKEGYVKLAMPGTIPALLKEGAEEDDEEEDKEVESDRRQRRSYRTCVKES